MKFRIVFAASALLAGGAEAAFVDYGYYTSDTTAGLDWLDVNYAGALTINSLDEQRLNGVGLGAEGWRRANVTDFKRMVANFYGNDFQYVQVWNTIYELAPAYRFNVSKTRELISLMGGGGSSLDGLLGDWAYTSGSTRYYQTAEVSAGTWPIFDRISYGSPVQVNGYPSPDYLQVYYTFDRNWLVRDTGSTPSLLVSEPTTIALTLCGLGGLGITSRRKTRKAARRPTRQPGR